MPDRGALAASRRQRCDCVMSTVAIDLETLTDAERRDLANAFLRAAWCATLTHTRTILLDALIDASVLGEASE